MKASCWSGVLITIVSMNEMLLGQVDDHDHWFKELCQQDTLTNECFGVLHRVEDKGFDATLSATQIYQQNLNGGLRTSDHSGRYTGSYDLEVVTDW